jgi:hypothetical protein
VLLARRWLTVLDEGYVEDDVEGVREAVDSDHGRRADEAFGQDQAHAEDHEVGKDEITVDDQVSPVEELGELLCASEASAKER